jgi:purine-binding chemotaxis protein CheW
MSEVIQLLVFLLEGQKYALPLGAVNRIVRAAEVTPLPQAPDIVLGVLDVEGTVLPVLNVRRRFRLPERPVRPTDQFLLAQAGARAVVLIVDAAEGLIEGPVEEIVEPSAVAPGLEHVRGVVRTSDGLVLIHDLERFLSLEEAGVLDSAMNPEVLHGT